MTILYEDNHIIAVNKTSNEIVQGDKTGDTPLSEMVKAYIKKKYNKPGEVFLGVPHRIDRPTSGVVLFARTSKALTRLCTLFSSHEKIKKTYLAIVEGKPEPAEARLEDYLLKNEVQNKSYVTTYSGGGHKTAKGKLATLSYKTLVVGDHYSLLEVNLETGRHHQIRCQLAHAGYPIKGDLKYGAKRSNPDGGICLHAWKIGFEHPVSHERVFITAPTPDDRMWNAFTS